MLRPARRENSGVPTVFDHAHTTAVNQFSLTIVKVDTDYKLLASAEALTTNGKR